MVGVAWAAIGLLATTLGFLVVALLGLRAEFRGQFGELRSEFGGQLGELRSEFGGQLGELRAELRDGFTELRSEMRDGFTELRSEMRDGFRAQGERIDALAARIDVHIDRHAS